MDEFLELEKKCKQLKTKQIIKYSIVILIVFVIVGLYLFFTSKSKIKQQESKPIQHIKHIKVKPKPLPKTEPKNHPKKIVSKVKEVKEINKTKVVTPKKIEVNKTQKVKIMNIPNWNVEFDLSKIDFSSEKKEIPVVKEIKEINKTKVVTPKKIEVNKTQQSKQIFKTETITFDKALKLAKFYYNNENYENSIKWCKIASNMDNDNEEIWKLYALNLEKLNQKEKAIKVLKTYLKYKDSQELKFILQRLEK